MILIGAIARSRTAGSFGLAQRRSTERTDHRLGGNAVLSLLSHRNFAGILLITAAPVRCFSLIDQLGPVLTQRTTAEAKMRAFKA